MICYGVGGGGGVAVKDGTPSRSLRSRARQPHKALHAKALGEAKCGLRGVVAIAAIWRGGNGPIGVIGGSDIGRIVTSYQ